jgi:hypothetical protein
LTLFHFRYNGTTAPCSRVSNWHMCFLFGRSRVQISALGPDVVSEVYPGFSQPLLANSEIASNIRAPLWPSTYFPTHCSLPDYSLTLLTLSLNNKLIKYFGIQFLANTQWMRAIYRIYHRIDRDRYYFGCTIYSLISRARNRNRVFASEICILFNSVISFHHFDNVFLFMR